MSAPKLKFRNWVRTDVPFHIMDVDWMHVSEERKGRDTGPFNTNYFDGKYKYLKGKMLKAIHLGKKLPTKKLRKISQRADKLITKVNEMAKTHDNLAGIESHYFSGGLLDLLIIVPDFKEGSLHDYVLEHTELSIKVRMGLFQQAVCCIADLVDNGFSCHDNFKAKNFMVEMVDGSPHLKVCDFNMRPLTKPIYVDQSGVLNSQYHAFPWPGMVKDKREPSLKSNLFGLGTLLYFLLTGEYPFKGWYSECYDESGRMTKAKWKRERPTLDRGWLGKKKSNLFRRLTEWDPKERMTLDQLCKLFYMTRGRGNVNESLCFI